MQVLEEAKPNWSYEEVTEMDFTDNYTYPDLTPDTVHWMKIDLHGDPEKPGTYLFRVGTKWRAWERSDVYYERGDSLIHQKLGYDIAGNEKLSAGFNSYFEVDLQAGGLIELYVRVDGTSACFTANQLQLYFEPGRRLEDTPYYSADGPFAHPTVLNYSYNECSEKLLLLKDPTGDLSLEQAREQLRTAPNIVNGAHFFELNEIYWGRLLLKGNQSFWGDQLFQIGRTNLGSFAKIDVYYQELDGTPVHIKTGSSRTVFQKPISHQVNFVEVKVPPNDTLEVLFRFEQKNRYFQKTTGRELVPIIIGHIGQSYEESNLLWIMFRKGILLGLGGMIAAYFFLFFLIERSRLYLYFSLLVFQKWTHF